jgi:hypothetical protein
MKVPSKLFFNKNLSKFFFINYLFFITFASCETISAMVGRINILLIKAKKNAFSIYKISTSQTTCAIIGIIRFTTKAS